VFGGVSVAAATAAAHAALRKIRLQISGSRWIPRLDLTLTLTLILGSRWILRLARAVSILVKDVIRRAELVVKIT